MTSTLSPSTKPAWSGAILPAASEFGPTALPILSGQIPAGLRGSLYRNGPGRLERNGDRVGHWFDGDGAILAVHLTEAGATGLYRFVQTEGYQEEERAGKLLYGGYGMTPRGALWERPGRALKNAANTSVLALPNQLLALWEGGRPHALDLETLATIGLEDLGSRNSSLRYSAHPKRDPQTGDLYNFGVSFGRQARIHLYRSDASGQIQQQGMVTTEGLSIIHDFVLAGPYLVFCVPPVRMNPLPVLTLMKSYSDSFSWQPELGTQIIVVDRNSLEVVARTEMEPWFQWHFGNGAELADGTVAIDLVRYADFQTNQFLKEVATGQTQTLAPSTLWQLRLEPRSGKVLEMVQVCDRPCEFPVVNPQDVGQPWRYTYLSVHRPDADPSRELFGMIARFDRQTGTLTPADLGPHRYPMEPIYAPDCHTPYQGWVLTVVYDSQQQTSEVWIYASDRLADGPVCRLALPNPTPIGFHGTWRPFS